MKIMKNIEVTKEIALDPDQLGECQCGNFAPDQYLQSDQGGNDSCPTCVLDWKDSIVEMYIQVAIATEYYKFSLEQMDDLIRHKLSEIIGVDSSELDPEWVDCFLLKNR